MHTLVYKCSHFNMNLFKYSDDKTFGFENDIDSDNNFYNFASKCGYYTDMQFKNNFSKAKGLSSIHFNARSLKGNLKKIGTTSQSLICNLISSPYLRHGLN